MLGKFFYHVAGESVAEHHDVELSSPDGLHGRCHCSWSAHPESVHAQDLGAIKRQLAEFADQQDPPTAGFAIFPMLLVPLFRTGRSASAFVATKARTIPKQN